MTKRVRMIAGPNGSGKSSVVKPVLEGLNVPLGGAYVNADEIEDDCKKNLSLDFAKYGIVVSENDFVTFASSHGLTKKYRFTVATARIVIHYWNKVVFFLNINYRLPSFDFSRLTWDGYKIHFPAWFVHSYFSALVADYVRHKLLEQGHSFTFETVMSDKDKIDFLKKAKANGYKIYLYFVTTQSSKINIGRVRERKSRGGHDVPKSKIKNRYERCMNQLYDAISLTDKCYLWDNSKGRDEHNYLGAIYEGKKVELWKDLDLSTLPAWFEESIIARARASKMN